MSKARLIVNPRITCESHTFGTEAPYGNSKNHNWVLLQDGFKNLQIKVASKLCTASKKSSTGSAILILKKLYLQLHDKQTNRMLPRLSGSENFGGNGTRSLWQREQISMLQRTERLGM